MIYTQPEIKKLLQDKIANGAEPDIILSAIVSIIAENEEFSRETFTKLLLQIIPGHFTAMMAIEGLIEAASLVAISQAKPDKVFRSHKVIQYEFTKIFLTTLLLAARDKDFAVAHGPELRRLKANEVPDLDIDPDILELFREHLQF